MLPKLSNVIRAYMQPLTFGLITKEIIDYKEVEVTKIIKTKGVRQPIEPGELLNIAGQGQRSWKWESLHLLPSVNMKPDDIVIFNKVKYRIKEKYDCSEYGYIEYIIAQTFEDEEE